MGEYVRLKCWLLVFLKCILYARIFRGGNIFPSTFIDALPGTLQIRRKKDRLHAFMLSHVQLFVTPCTVPPRLLWPWNFPDKNTGAGCHFLLQGIFPTQIDWTHISCVSCIGRQVLYQLLPWAMGESPKDRLTREKTNKKKSWFINMCRVYVG